LQYLKQQKASGKSAGGGTFGQKVEVVEGTAGEDQGEEGERVEMKKRKSWG
jgi:hypothetical protein